MTASSPSPPSTAAKENIEMSAIQEINAPRVSDDVHSVESESTDDDDSLVGAPVEKVRFIVFGLDLSFIDCLVLQINPLGHQVTLLSCVMLNLGQMLGSGIFSTPGVILNSVGSIGLLLLFWVLAPLFAYGMPDETFEHVNLSL